jgi:hypothetical protein
MSARWTVKWFDGKVLKLAVFQCEWEALPKAIEERSFDYPVVLSVERAPELVL